MFFDTFNNIFGTVAQLVEQRTENPCVSSSTLLGPTKWSFSSAGSEQYPYKVEVVSSNLTRTTIISSIVVMDNMPDYGSVVEGSTPSLSTLLYGTISSVG